jgi:carboxymethylenebutenolidase
MRIRDWIGALVVVIGTASGPAAADDAKRGATGAVSEAQFKAMHELKKGAVAKLHGQMIDLAGGKAYLSLPPKAKAPMPAVLVIQEWWGLNDNIKHWADRLAASGYAALAVDLYDGKVATTSEDAMKLMQGVDAARAREILLAGHAFLKSDQRVQATKRGSIGWCFGGGQSLRLAMAAPDLDACVMYYGFPVLDSKELAAIRAPVLAVWGNLDDAIPPSTVDEFDKALTAAEVEHTFHRYDAVHAFANPSNARYDEKSAEDAWTHVQAFFAKHLKP